MILLNKVAFTRYGIDLYVNGSWYGIHTYWQSIPLFDWIHNHKKCNSVHEYGFIFMGVWVYLRIDT